ncbi:kanamycin nucleotidyltransferase C-terminal domain-containing protein [Bacillus salitolerans]|uniref:Kanamycin nucleotidyltransferase C-terminal domain-containing protein n=1 Tax=Bacillus salitolerans TaxID=1437434 RepID=A0ABW4LTM0_9BACI
MNTTFLLVQKKDFSWQTAKLIGLANKKYYITRARTFEESLKMETRPTGYDEQAHLVMEGTLANKDLIYQRCELLWIGLNEWF